MNEIIKFFKDIVSVNMRDCAPVGLSSFKPENFAHEIIVPKKKHKKEELRLSDLMRRVS